jgi:hypothetical protein
MSGISDETELRTSLRNADFSQLDVDEEEDTQEGRFLTFSLAEEDYGIGISSVRGLAEFLLVRHTRIFGAVFFGFCARCFCL